MRFSAINTNNFAGNGKRIDAGYHLSDGVSIRRIIKNSPYSSVALGELSNRIFYGIRANRTYVTNPQYAIPFLTGANIKACDISHTKLISKRYTPSIDEMTLCKDWVLITRSGTVGQTAWSNKNYEGKYGSEDIIRLVPNEKMKGGVIYAYLSSKYGQALLTQGAFGAVIQHIEPSFVSSINIPVFPSHLQDEVHELIIRAAENKEKADYYLRSSHKEIEKPFTISRSHNHKVPISLISSTLNKRFEGNYYASVARDFYNEIISSKHIRVSDMTQRIFRPGIFKREYSTNGVPFLGGADIMDFIPSTEKKLSHRQVESMPELMANKGWLLLTCGGTIGNIVFVDTPLSKYAISQHVMRIIPNNDTAGKLLFAFLSSDLGRNVISMFPFGSVIPQIEPEHISIIPIPVYSKEVESIINYNVEQYVHHLELAKEQELRAINLVEDEISSWK